MEYLKGGFILETYCGSEFADHVNYGDINFINNAFIGDRYNEMVFQLIKVESWENVTISDNLFHTFFSSSDSFEPFIQVTSHEKCSLDDDDGRVKTI